MPTGAHPTAPELLLLPMPRRIERVGVKPVPVPRDLTVAGADPALLERTLRKVATWRAYGLP